MLSLLYANFGYHPRRDFELDIHVNNPEEKQAQTAAGYLYQIHEVARSEMRNAQAQQ